MKVSCPVAGFDQRDEGGEPQYWIELPGAWLGVHAERRDEVLADTSGMGQTLRSFAVALALLDNWSLPGLTGPPEKWDFTQLDLRVIAWVSQTVLEPFNDCFRIPKKNS